MLKPFSQVVSTGYLYELNRSSKDKHFQAQHNAWPQEKNLESQATEG